MNTTLPQDDAERKDAPMFRGLLGYFPWALFQVAAHSLRSDRKHNPGSKTGPNWTRGKSTDHPDCIVRHLAEAYGPPPATFIGTQDDWTEYHLTALAWRSNALLQEFGEAKRGAAPGVSCRFQAPAPGVLAEATVALAEKTAERWGIFRDGILSHGQITKLTSEHAARTCGQFDEGCRVARIERVKGVWQEAKS